MPALLAIAWPSFSLGSLRRKFVGSFVLNDAGQWLVDHAAAGSADPECEVDRSGSPGFIGPIKAAKLDKHREGDHEAARGTPVDLSREVKRRVARDVEAAVRVSTTISPHRSSRLEQPAIG